MPFDVPITSYTLSGKSCSCSQSLARKTGAPLTMLSMGVRSLVSTYRQDTTILLACHNTAAMLHRTARYLTELLTYSTSG